MITAPPNMNASAQPRQSNSGASSMSLSPSEVFSIILRQNEKVYPSDRMPKKKMHIPKGRAATMPTLAPSIKRNTSASPEMIRPTVVPIQPITIIG
jgi:hypothetical protein